MQLMVLHRAPYDRAAPTAHIARMIDAQAATPLTCVVCKRCPGTDSTATAWLER